MKLKTEDKMIEYQEKMEQKDLDRNATWDQITKSILKETYGLQEKRSKTNEWMLGHEEDGMKYKKK